MKFVLIVLIMINTAIAGVYDTLSNEFIPTNTDLELKNVSFDPYKNNKPIKTQIKQCNDVICIINLDVRTSSFITLPKEASITHYILGDTYNFRFIQKSKNTAIVYTTNNHNNTNLIIISADGNIYPIHLLTNQKTVDLVVNITTTPIELANVSTKKDGLTITTKTVTQAAIPKTIVLGSLSEYLDIDLVNEDLTRAIQKILLGWQIRFADGVDKNKLVSITAESSSALTRENAIISILAQFNYKALFYKQKQIVIITL